MVTVGFNPSTLKAHFKASTGKLCVGCCSSYTYSALNHPCYVDPTPPAWSATVTYMKNDCVTHNSKLYYSVIDNNNAPFSLSYWQEYEACGNEDFDSIPGLGGIGKTPQKYEVLLNYRVDFKYLPAEIGDPWHWYKINARFIFEIYKTEALSVPSWLCHGGNPEPPTSIGSADGYYIDDENPTPCALELGLQMIGTDLVLCSSGLPGSNAWINIQPDKTAGCPGVQPVSINKYINTCELQGNESWQTDPNHDTWVLTVSRLKWRPLKNTNVLHVSKCEELTKVSAGCAGGHYKGKARFTIKDEANVLVENAVVTGSISPGGSFSKVTDAAGQVEILSNCAIAGSTITFTVTNLAKLGYSYDAESNTCDSVEADV